MRVILGVFGAHGSQTCWGHKRPVNSEIVQRRIAVVNMVRSKSPKKVIHKLDFIELQTPSHQQRAMIRGGGR